MMKKKSTMQNSNNTFCKEATKPKARKRRDKSDLGPDFIAPDGGWGWIVCLAAGFSNFSIFPPLQQYGLIYRKRMSEFGFDAKQSTTIVNIVLGLSALVGLVNGAMFRRFSFRQVAIVGSFLSFTGILLSAFCETFVEYLICFSSIYGIGLGLCLSANSLAVNTYFKNKRRKATGFSWTLTGLGPIVFPHVSTVLLAYYGAQGSILVYAAISLNALLSSITFQPVLWHSPKSAEEMPEVNGNIVQNGIVSNKEHNNFECKYCQYQKKEKRSIFTSQYLFNEDDQETPGFEIIEPGTPMMARANDGWYGSKLSLTNKKSPGCRYNYGIKQIFKQDCCEKGFEQQEPQERSLFIPNHFNREKQELERFTSKLSIYSKSGANGSHCTCHEEKALLKSTCGTDKKEEQAQLEDDEYVKSHMTFWQKIVQFFDLDLLRDFTFVNLAAGMSVMTFGEINFSILTPFIMNSLGYTDTQISLAMSLLAGMDIAVRFFAPFALERVKLSNQVLFAFGIIAISIGRLIVTLTDSYNVTLAVFLLIGFGKGFRTIFSPLVIPSYVPLNRLPAASGLYLIFSSIAYCVFGQVLGLITHSFGYTVTVHSINVLTWIALALWLLEAAIRRSRDTK